MIPIVKSLSIRSMHSFDVRHAIVLVLVLTQKFAICGVENVTRERTASAKLVTKYLESPWINLDSSWTDKVTSQCSNDIVTLFESADAGEMWALQMLDASSKVPSGILRGNIRDLGMYDECMGVKDRDNSENIQARHCMVSLSIPSTCLADASANLYLQKISPYNPSSGGDLSLTISVCLPSSCSVNDALGLVSASVQSMPKLAASKVNVAQVTCSNGELLDDLTPGLILAMLFFAILGSFLLLCTVCDFVMRARFCNVSSSLKTMAKFSIYTNAKHLLDTKINPETMPAIHGFRCLNTCLVVVGHRIAVIFMKPLVNLSDVAKIRHTMTGSVAMTLPRVVDIFFVMSGFLTAFSFLKHLRSGRKLNLPLLYLHRYIRLTPCLATLLLFNIFILPYLGSGPMWEMVIGVTNDYCRKNWWTNLLYIQNFVNRQEMCILNTWYLAVEMHFFWLCPIILYPLYYRPKLGLKMLVAVSIAAFITPAVHIVVNNYSAFIDATKDFAEMYYDFFNSYTITYNRALPYLVGILLGYDVANNKRRFTKVQVAINWSLTGFVILFCVWASHFSQPIALEYDVVWEAAQVSILRLGWSLAIAWILYACTQGYGGPVTRFLSLPIFIPLSRMCYCIYLVHTVIQVGTTATMRTAGFFTYFDEINLLSRDLMMSVAVAFILTLCIETPVIVLEKIIRNKRSSPVKTSECESKQTRLKQEGKVPTVIKEYLGSTKNQVESDLAINTRTSQLDFWQTVSDVLNGLGKRPTKSPTQLAKAWEEWKTDVSQNDRHRESLAKDIQERSTQIQTEPTTLKQELFIFLAAVSCDADDMARFEESDIVEPTRSSQLDSCDLQDKNLVRLPTSDSKSFVKKTK